MRYNVSGTDITVEILGWEQISPYCMAAYVYDIDTGDSLLVREDNLIPIKNE